MGLFGKTIDEGTQKKIDTLRIVNIRRDILHKIKTLKVFLIALKTLEIKKKKRYLMEKQTGQQLETNILLIH